MRAHPTLQIYLNEQIRPLLVALLIVTTLVVTSVGAAGASSRLQRAPRPTNVDVSQRPGNESEETVAVNPTNPNNIVIVTNVDFPAAGLFEGASFDGGSTWTTKLIGDNDNLGDACCDPSLSFDSYGNLFMTYLYNVEIKVPIALSTDGGLSFNRIANIAKPPKSLSAGPVRRPADDHGWRGRGLAGVQRRRSDRSHGSACKGIRAGRQLHHA